MDFDAIDKTLAYPRVKLSGIQEFVSFRTGYHFFTEWERERFLRFDLSFAINRFFTDQKEELEVILSSDPNIDTEDIFEQLKDQHPEEGMILWLDLHAQGKKSAYFIIHLKFKNPEGNLLIDDLGNILKEFAWEEIILLPKKYIILDVKVRSEITFEKVPHEGPFVNLSQLYRRWKQNITPDFYTTQFIARRFPLTEFFKAQLPYFSDIEVIDYRSYRLRDRVILKRIKNALKGNYIQAGLRFCLDRREYFVLDFDAKISSANPSHQYAPFSYDDNVDISLQGIDLVPASYINMDVSYNPLQFALRDIDNRNFYERGLYDRSKNYFFELQHIAKISHMGFRNVDVLTDTRTDLCDAVTYLYANDRVSPVILSRNELSEPFVSMIIDQMRGQNFDEGVILDLDFGSNHELTPGKYLLVKLQAKNTIEFNFDGTLKDDFDPIYTIFGFLSMDHVRMDEEFYAIQEELLQDEAPSHSDKIVEEIEEDEEVEDSGEPEEDISSPDSFSQSTLPRAFRGLELF